MSCKLQVVYGAEGQATYSNSDCSLCDPNVMEGLMQKFMSAR